jgi:NADH:ubiquinone oxidoreductase subunit E
MSNKENTDQPKMRELREFVSQYSFEKGHLLPALLDIQATYGYVSKNAMEALARQFRTSTALIYGAITFYSDIRTEPPPDREIVWCSGPACRIYGGERIRQAIEHTLKLSLESQSADGRYGFQLGQCNGTCSQAPQIWVDGEVRGKLSVSDAIRIARDMKEGD